VLYLSAPTPLSEFRNSFRIRRREESLGVGAKFRTGIGFVNELSQLSLNACVRGYPLTHFAIEIGDSAINRQGITFVRNPDSLQLAVGLVAISATTQLFGPTTSTGKRYTLNIGISSTLCLHARWRF
jgi:hypothetical protein